MIHTISSDSAMMVTIKSLGQEEITCRIPLFSRMPFLKRDF